MKCIHAIRAVCKTLLVLGIGAFIPACGSLYAIQPECAMSAEIPVSTNRVCASTAIGTKPVSAILQVNKIGTGDVWVLSITGPDPVPTSQAALMPRFVNDASEVVRPQRLAFVEDRLEVEFAYSPQHGGSELVMYRLSLRQVENAWRVTNYASAFKQRGQSRYRVNSADLRALKMMSCDFETAFTCPPDQRTTPLVNQALILLSDMPMLPEYSLKPDVKTLIR